MNYFEELKIADLITESILGVISEEKRRVLDRWIDECEANRILYQKFVQDKNLISKVYEKNDIQEINVNEVINNIHIKINRNGYRPILKKKRTIKIWKIVSAACIIVLLALPVLLLKNEKNAEMLSDSKVKIILADGKEIYLNESTQNIKTVGGVISVNESGLSFTTEDEGAKVFVHSIVTDIGGEIIFNLPDGSKIWMNAKSRLDFPSKFTSEERRVALSGEAFFEVATDKEKPFIVETGEVSTTVLGTSFNINAYEDEPEIKTTLLTGKVLVSYKERTVELQPGFAAIVKEGNDIQVSQVDVEMLTAWKSGYFIFRDEELSVITRALSRWYDVEFVMDESSLGHTFNGRINKYISLEEILERITLTGGPVFRIEGKTVYVE